MRTFGVFSSGGGIKYYFLVVSSHHYTVDSLLADSKWNYSSVLILLNGGKKLVAPTIKHQGVCLLVGAVDSLRFGIGTFRLQWKNLYTHL